MTDSVRKLARELKQFLKTAASEDLLAVSALAQQSVPQDVASGSPKEPAGASPVAKEIAGSSKASAPTENSTQMASGSTLEVSFARAAAPVSTMTQDKTTALNQLADTIKACQRCPLGATRLNAVPGEGNVNATVMFIGEGPGFDEDRQGRPFVGRAGQLLTKMILAMGLTREEVYIANIAKCHPMTDPLHPEKHGNDRAPNAQEIACCRKYIEQQIAIISPKYVVALGGVAAKALISDAASLGALRGKFHNLHLDSVELKTPVQILATYHPAALLRNPNWKKDAWADLQLVMDKLGLKGARK